MEAHDIACSKTILVGEETPGDEKFHRIPGIGFFELGDDPFPPFALIAPGNQRAPSGKGIHRARRDRSQAYEKDIDA